MKRRSLQVLVLSLALLVPVVAVQALPAWLPGITVLGSAGPESGGPGLMTITAMMLEGASASATVSPDGNSITFGMGSLSMAGMWDLNWTSITLDRDPNVSFSGSFTNTGMMATDFIFSIATPIFPSLPSTLYGGSTSVTFGDASFDGLGGLFNDTSGNPAYVGTIDGAPALNMLVSLNLVPAFAGDATQTASETLGLPGPTIAGPAANSTIGILHRFKLSPGDQATYNSTFQVVIPEPSTIVLVGFGALGLLAAARRVKAHR